MVLCQKFMQWAVFTLMVMGFGLCSAVDLTAQQAASAPGAPKQGAAAGAAVAGSTNAEFAAAADEVLEQMSEITGLKLLTPLNDTNRTRWAVTVDPITRRDFNLMFAPATETVSGISQTVPINIEIEAKRAE